MDNNFQDQVETFASEVVQLLDDVLGLESEEFPASALSVSAGEPRFSIGLQEAEGKPRRIPLYSGARSTSGSPIGYLTFRYNLGLDRTGKYLKVWRSDFALYSVVSRQPLVRLEYDAEMRTAPKAHWQFHGERGDFTHLLTLGGQPKSGAETSYKALSALHFPVGGDRFRPGLEDFLQFLVSECGVRAKAGWESAILNGRLRWRVLQAKSAARDFQQEVADSLRDCGWQVTPPATKVDPDSAVDQTAW